MVEKTNSAYRFYEGDHWHGLKSGGEKMPIIEVIRPIVDYKTATVTANKMEAYFRPQENADSRETEVICSMLNARFSREWENSYIPSKKEITLALTMPNTALNKVIADFNAANEEYFVKVVLPEGAESFDLSDDMFGKWEDFRKQIQMELSAGKGPDLLGDDVVQNPEDYGNLVVRVGGFSDNFVKLSPAIQKEVIKRTQYAI